MCCTRLAGNTGRKNYAKNRHRAVSSQLRHISTVGKNLLRSDMFSRCSHNMVNFGPLAAEIGPVVWGTRANFNGFRVLAALLHGTPVVGVSQTLRRWAEGVISIQQGGHHVGYWPTFYLTIAIGQTIIFCPVVSVCLSVVYLSIYRSIYLFFSSPNLSRYLYSAGRPSRWALAHISSTLFLTSVYLRK